MAEEVFYDAGAIKVTSNRLVFGPQTFQLSGITSVRAEELPVDLLAMVILMILGFIFCVGIGAVLVYIWFKKVEKPTYEIILVSAAGETSAYKSHDREEISRIVKAVNDAMASRA